MADIDLRALTPSDLVLHFGGRLNEVDAFTFSNSLIAFGEALREINAQVNENYCIEVSIEANGPGSFRAHIATKLKSLGGLLSHDARNVIAGILATFIYLKIDPQEPPKIIINDDSVVIQTGTDRVIVPRATWEAREKIRNHSAIETHVRKAFSVMEEDASISNFGIASSIHDKYPIALIDRGAFAVITREPEEVGEDDNKTFKDEKTKLTVLKLVFERGNRKWQFVWNGIKISAPIRSDEFFDKLASREYDFSQGDVLDVTLRVHQIRDEISGVFINSDYEVLEVHGLEKMPRQRDIFR
jgi:hypothetical protein